ncbi:androgen-induced gene 1 protein-like [Ostrinia nubilalis]|uniref:androgen-induced gene 1 protein-like n=1 Tax=Ostrinia nubilalis TaxID=29057 RepID=UPI0030825128
MYDQMYLELPFTTGELYGELILKGRWSLVTFWCMGLQTVYFTLSLLNDLIGTNELSPSPQKKPLIRTIKDLTFALAFPMALFVTITFWALYFYEKNLVYPDEIDILVPHWQDSRVGEMVNMGLSRRTEAKSRASKFSTDLW